MKYLLIAIAVLFISGSVYSYDMLKIGDNVVEYVQKNPVKIKLNNIKPISEWPEGRVIFYTYSQKAGESPVIVFANFNYCIGVLQGKGTNSYYLFDLDGDNNLDTKTTFDVLPYWVVLADSTNRSKKDNITRIMDELYQAYQDDEGPADRLIGVNQMIAAFFPDNNIPNRDMAYLLYFYMKYNQALPEQSISALNMLTQAFQDRFNKIHPLILLYSLESHINMGDKKGARDILKELKKVDPEYIPGMVYDYQLEEDLMKAKTKYDELKKKYPNHWFVKQVK
jgi:hypothetical protein